MSIVDHLRMEGTAVGMQADRFVRQECFDKLSMSGKNMPLILSVSKDHPEPVKARSS